MEILKKQEKSFLLTSLLVYIICVISYVVWDTTNTEKVIFQQIDERLTIAASAMKFILAIDFHDRAVDQDSISFEEELKNRQAVSTYGFDSGFAWIYTLAEKDGKFYFSAPSVSEEEARERERWYWLPYDDIPDDFVLAFNKNETVFLNYTDQWGTFRSIAKSEQSPEGKSYLACADYDITYVKALLRKNIYHSIITALVFFLFSLPFLLTFRLTYKAFNKKMTHANKKLAAHRDNLEIQVEKRTAELQSAKDKSDALVKDLGQALEEVKTLRGFLPICSQCKKIRDDEGYWQVLEKYIEARSQAAFSHGLCPDCIHNLYPDIAEELANENKIPKPGKPSA